MANRKDMTAAYFAALSLPSDTESSQDVDEKNIARKSALDRAHEMRKFEIENYWKRATYFWSFQAIAFLVLGFIIKDGKLLPPWYILQIPAAIGAISGFVGYLSARGSKFWQENWEAHVDMLEHHVEGHLTQLIWSSDGASHSVSRLNQLFLGMLTLGWTAAMALASCPPLATQFMQLPAIAGFAALLFALVSIFLLTQSNLTGYRITENSWIDDTVGWRWNWLRLRLSKDRRQLIIRDTRACDASQPPSEGQTQ